MAIVRSVLIVPIAPHPIVLILPIDHGAMTDMRVQTARSVQVGMTEILVLNALTVRRIETMIAQLLVPLDIRRVLVNEMTDHVSRNVS
jgi:hypothetical protein